jgi:hypothetical protein
MPDDYEAVRDKLIGGGMPADQAKKHAAMITNAARKKAGKPSINAAVAAEKKK